MWIVSGGRYTGYRTFTLCPFPNVRTPRPQASLSPASNLFPLRSLTNHPDHPQPPSAHLWSNLRELLLPPKRNGQEDCPKLCPLGGCSLNSVSAVHCHTSTYPADPPKPALPPACSHRHGRGNRHRRDNGLGHLLCPLDLLLPSHGRWLLAPSSSWALWSHSHLCPQLLIALVPGPHRTSGVVFRRTRDSALAPDQGTEVTLPRCAPNSAGCLFTDTSCRCAEHPPSLDFR